ncbi:sulfite exporter TauE/SafE family protein [Maridesulfovibrio ferrireducens]|uniref:sulfite exporter TauE/SafE family protein n=1 Tax=Maridesulfovibrio ferrireducens TaxID=246191 RepID=UPI001A2682FE|nr:sulfite exporter TauE/SafE family protein [Maridesulfovibrio ferrireducens]MBI9110624.1 sulfite exporter TauE/SafE family protein [Maridesulfovibrio ferrireducens]
MISTLLIFVVLGVIAGILAGLLGIGGGLVIVPILYFALPQLGITEAQLMHVALGTSLATIIFTSISSMRAHNSRGAIRWDIFKTITPGILIGTFLGSCFAAYLNTTILKIIFVIFLYYVASQMLLGLKPKASRQVPGTWGMFGAGNAIGAMSSLVGIGGGTLSVPFLTMCNIPIHTAIGTAAAIGLPIALAGTAGFIWTGIGVQGLPDWTIGFIYLPALIGIVSTSMLTAPFGAKLAHSLPVAKLKMIFAILLLVVATKMLISLF